MPFFKVKLYREERQKHVLNRRKATFKILECLCGFTPLKIRSAGSTSRSAGLVKISTISVNDISNISVDISSISVDNSNISDEITKSSVLKNSAKISKS